MGRELHNGLGLIRYFLFEAVLRTVLRDQNKLFRTSVYYSRVQAIVSHIVLI